MTEKDMERLEKFEKMLLAVQEQYADAVGKMEKLKAEGKEKSVTFRQIMSQKMQLQNFLSMYRIYGVIGEE